jgi:hypothetical protein
LFVWFFFLKKKKKKKKQPKQEEVYYLHVGNRQMGETSPYFESFKVFHFVFGKTWLNPCFPEKGHRSSFCVQLGGRGCFAKRC